MQEQLELLRADQAYEEDLAIIALASEFASLTSAVPWRPAFMPVRAVQMIIDNSFFTYPHRILREFLDYVAISLCDNQKILAEGALIVVAAIGREGNTAVEVCEITHSSRQQSRPVVNRIATIELSVDTEPKLRIVGVDLDSLRPDPLNAHYELTNDDTRRIVYVIDPGYDGELYASTRALARSGGLRRSGLGGGRLACSVAAFENARASTATLRG